MSETLQEIGAIAGFFSFAAFCALAVVYVLRWRELRRLRRIAPFLVDGSRTNGTGSDAPARRRAPGG